MHGNCCIEAFSAIVHRIEGKFVICGMQGAQGYGMVCAHLGQEALGQEASVSNRNVFHFLLTSTVLDRRQCSLLPGKTRNTLLQNTLTNKKEQRSS